MERRLRLALFVCVALLVAAPSVFAQKGSKAKAAGTAASYRRAYETVEAGVNALGGVEALRAAEDVWVKTSGWTWARNQSVRVSSPWDKMTRDETLYADVRRGRFIFENRDPLPGGFVFGGRNVISGGQGFFVNERDRTVVPLITANLPAIQFNFCLKNVTEGRHFRSECFELINEVHTYLVRYRVVGRRGCYIKAGKKKRAKLAASPSDSVLPLLDLLRK